MTTLLTFCGLDCGSTQDSQSKPKLKTLRKDMCTIFVRHLAKRHSNPLACECVCAVCKVLLQLFHVAGPCGTLRDRLPRALVVSRDTVAAGYIPVRSPFQSVALSALHICMPHCCRHFIQVR
jgi:hypothetical protein